MSLVNISHIGDLTPSEKLEINLISMFDWGFVHKGGYINRSPVLNSGVPYNISDSVGQDYRDLTGGGYSFSTNARLTLSKDPRYTLGQVWQGHENWVYESGSIASPVPFNEPIVFVDYIQISSGDVVYNDGRIYFDNPIPTGSIVDVKHSYKWVNFTSAQNVPFIRRINREGTNDFSIPETVLPLPLVAFDVPPITSSRYYGMGRLSPRVFNHTIKANVFAELRGDALKIADWICMQEAYSFATYDPFLVDSSGDNPLNLDGTLNSGKNFQQLTDLYPWVYFEILSAEAKNGSLGTQNLHHVVVTLKTQIIGCMFPV